MIYILRLKLIQKLFSVYGRCLEDLLSVLGMIEWQAHRIYDVNLMLGGEEDAE